MTRIAVPVQGEEFSEHFGQSTGFALFEAPEGGGAVARLDLDAPRHEHGAFAAFLREQGTDVVLAGGMGAGAQRACAEAGITVVVGVRPAEPHALVASYLQGSLSTATNACGGHGCAH